MMVFKVKVINKANLKVIGNLMVKIILRPISSSNKVVLKINVILNANLKVKVILKIKVNLKTKDMLKVKSQSQSQSQLHQWFKVTQRRTLQGDFD